MLPNVRYIILRSTIGIVFHAVARLTCNVAHNRARVGGPASIYCTHCCHILRCKPLVTFEKYLSSFSCVLIGHNGSISRDSRSTTIGWSEEYHALQAIQ